jgi:hypothetical protein
MTRIAVNIENRILASVSVSIEATANTYGVRLNIPPQTGIIVAVVVVKFYARLQLQQIPPIKHYL